MVISNFSNETSLNILEIFEKYGFVNIKFDSVVSDEICFSSDKFRLKFLLDLRDGLISSTVEFTDDITCDNKLFYTHILSTIIEDEAELDYSLGKNSKQIIGNEVLKICKVINYIDNNSISCRDMNFYTIGYNNAYTYLLNIGNLAQRV